MADKKGNARVAKSNKAAKTARGELDNVVA